MSGKKATNDGRLMTPLTDWSFKFIFSREESKTNLIGFLNLILTPESPIVDVKFLNNEVIPVAAELKGTVFDIICEDACNNKYLIEVQNQQAENIRERILFYTCRLIDRMGKKGKDWDYSDIKKVYSICLMNFTYESNPKLRRDVLLYDINENRPFSDKLNIILLQLPCAKSLNLNECNSYYEYLLSLLKEMDKEMKTLDELKHEVSETALPQAMKEFFYNILDTAHVGSLSEQERIQYEADLKSYRDTMSCIRFAKAEGQQEEKLRIAKSMKEKNIDYATIAQCTNLTIEQIENL